MTLATFRPPRIPRIAEASLVSFVLVVLNYAGYYLFGWPLATEWIAEWIMAHTPNSQSVWMLTNLGAWAKPLAVTGGLAAMGFLTWVAMMALRTPEFARGRRDFLTSVTMTGATAAVAVESYWRDQRFASHAKQPVPLFTPRIPDDSFAPALVRKPITPVGQFYVMSKNTVDPALDPDTWRLKITVAGKTLRELSYRELLSAPLERRFQTLRCVSNTLKSDLMGTAEWAGLPLSKLVSPSDLPEGIVEMAVIGVDGHGDSFKPEYAFTAEPMLAIGMNGSTLNRNHGYPARLLTPRYYGFKNIKWIAEIAFVREPYVGTWPKLGYTKEPVIHTCSFIDRIRREGSRLRVGGVSFAGVRGIRQVQVRVEGGPWVSAALEPVLSPYTLTRWQAELDGSATAEFLEARSMDGTGQWQSEVERPLFPDGMSGPTRRRIS